MEPFVKEAWKIRPHASFNHEPKQNIPKITIKIIRQKQSSKCVV